MFSDRPGALVTFPRIRYQILVALLCVSLVGCTSKFDQGYQALESERYGEALPIFTELAAQYGQSSAKNNLGYLYENGFGVRRNLPEAVRWYELAVAEDSKLAVAHTNLGVMLLYGRGTSQDTARASKLFRVAADLGDARAQYFLGAAYEKGLGVSLNSVEAIRLYKLSADQGNEQAAERLSAINSSEFRQRKQKITEVRREIDRLDRRAEYSGSYDYSNGCDQSEGFLCGQRFSSRSFLGRSAGRLMGYYEIENPDSSISYGTYMFPNTTTPKNRLTGKWEDEFGQGKVELVSSDNWLTFEGRWFVRENNGSYAEKGSWGGRLEKKQTLVSLFEPQQRARSADKDLAKLQQGFLSSLESQLAAASEDATFKADTTPPMVSVQFNEGSSVRGVLRGQVSDQSGIAEFRIDGRPVDLSASGEFEYSTYVPPSGKEVVIEAVDYAGLAATKKVRMKRLVQEPRRERLASVNPLVGPKHQASPNRAALIIGLENYEASPPAKFASKDAETFADFAREKLGVPTDKIKILTNAAASEREILRALKVWLPTMIKPGKTDLYVFYAGHGMPASDGSSAYIVPYDGDVILLEDTAISRKRFFEEIGAWNPRTATFFFDSCFSGATRNEELLVAARPLGIKVQNEEVPSNYVVFSAGESDQVAGVIDEVRHGRFSYFLFKGLEGDADVNQDSKISAAELHSYIRKQVGRFSGGAQTPEIIGDRSTWIIN